MTEILRYSAFTTDPAGGNPAGVVLDARSLDEAAMRALAAEVGYSESAFVFPKVPGTTGNAAANTTAGPTRLGIRYFSPEIEIDFCGHATIATAIAWAHRHGAGDLLLETKAGEIAVELAVEDGVEDGDYRATLTSVPTRSREARPEDVAESLAALGWQSSELDPALPPRIAYGGVDHLVLAVSSRQRLADLDYDFERLKALMQARSWITLQLAWRESETVFHVRDPFPVGGVVEDPATGAAAAAFGGYLRDLGRVSPPCHLTLHQGADMGRPSELRVELRPEDRRSRVSGRAVPIVAGPLAGA